jgi:hypothetical protein
MLLMMARMLPPAAAMTTCFLVAVVAVTTDAALRPGFGESGPWRHVLAAGLLYSVAAALLGAVAALATWVSSRAAGTRGERWVRWGVAALAATLAAAAVRPTATFTFGTERLADTWLGRFGPGISMGVVGVAAAVTAVWLMLAVRSARKGRGALAVVTTVLFAALAVGLQWVDQTVYVSLYARLHAGLEAVSALALAVALAPAMGWVLARDTRAARAVQGGAIVLAAVGSLAATSVVASASVRSWASETLRHTWRQPLLAGRMLARAQFVESYLRNPGAWTDETISGVELLRRRFDLGTTARAARWDEPLAEPPWLQDRLTGLRQGKTYNVVLYYVDTLRADVAFDPKVMPSVSRFAASALSYRRAYTTGSDTLHALPGLTGGSFDLFDAQPNDLLVVARRAGYRTTLVAAQSAREFLHKLLPRFAFAETLEVPDYVRGNNKVWGYGADQPTAARIVDRALEWIGAHRDQPFLTWMFNFDIHAWRELDQGYVDAAAKTYGVVDAEGALAWRYRVVARALDAEFGRFLRGLDDLGVADDTIVVFVSDHGEGLGREGFWVHSVFLWESLVRVPLILRVPGLSPRRIDAPVSLVDVAPTLSRFMVSGADTQGYQGEDLLGYAGPEHPPRRTPLVLAGTSKEKLVRLGIIDPEGRYKLVVPLKAAVPELYDLTRPDPDGEDVSARHPEEVRRLLNELVQAPLFPRALPGVPDADRRAALR